MKLKQIICPLLPEIFLVGGLSFGHSWRRVEGTIFMFCKKCRLKKSLISYAADSEEGKFYLNKLPD